MRRNFLLGLTAAGFLGVGGHFSSFAGQVPRPKTDPPQQDPRTKDDDLTPPFPARKKILEENEKDIKKSIEKLFQLASDLKAEVEKTNSAEVLSLALVRKAEEIEKLAHEIKTRAKG